MTKERKPGLYEWIRKGTCYGEIVNFTSIHEGVVVTPGQSGRRRGHWQNNWVSYHSTDWEPVRPYYAGGLKLTIPEPVELSDTDRLEAKLDKLIELMSSKPEKVTLRM